MVHPSQWWYIIAAWLPVVHPSWAVAHHSGVVAELLCISILLPLNLVGCDLQLELQVCTCQRYGMGGTCGVMV